MQMIEKKGMHTCFRLLETLLLVIKDLHWFHHRCYMGEHKSIKCY